MLAPSRYAERRSVGLAPTEVQKSSASFRDGRLNPFDRLAQEGAGEVRDARPVGTGSVGSRQKYLPNQVLTHILLGSDDALLRSNSGSSAWPTTGVVQRLGCLVVHAHVAVQDTVARGRSKLQMGHLMTCCRM